MEEQEEDKYPAIAGGGKKSLSLFTGPFVVVFKSFLRSVCQFPQGLWAVNVHLCCTRVPVVL